jgi:hypothetical protein
MPRLCWVGRSILEVTREVVGLIVFDVLDVLDGIDEDVELDETALQ